MYHRDFLPNGFRTTVVVALGLPYMQSPAAAAIGDGGSSKFLFVFFSGGMHAASLLVPIGSSFYYETRPDIAKPNSDTASALPATTDWELHPVFRDSLYPLFRQG
jgi:uncharacterized protein (DUF1501 family)